MGEGFADDAIPIVMVLARRAASVDDEALREGEIPEVRLEIRGILVGVSFGLPDIEFIKDEGGGSLASFPADWLRLVPTDGDPAIVGSWFRVVVERNEESDCFCMELTVCEVILEDIAREGPEVEADGVDEIDDEVETLSLATR